MERIEPGKYVELGYDLYRLNPDGTETLMHQTDTEDPEAVVFGVTRGMIRPLEKALEGLTVGDSYDVKATAEEAYGMPDPEQVAELPRDIFVVDGKFDAERIYPGAVLPMMTEDGYRIDGVVKEVAADKVVMDFNHPLAGFGVRIAGKVLTVRDATPEELQPVHSCGCGCGHDHDHCDHDHCGHDHGHDHGCGCGDGHCCE